MKAFQDSEHEFSVKAIENNLKVLRQKSADEVFEALGSGHLTGGELLEKLFPGERRSSAMTALNRMLPARFRRGSGHGGRHAVPIRGLLPVMAVHYAKCCSPLPGDRIVGIVTEGEGVRIHTIDCERLADVADDSDLWLDVMWDVDADTADVYTGRISVTVTNEPGSLSSLSTTIAKNHGNIANLRITDRGTDYFVMCIDIEVADAKHLIDIIAALRATPQVNSVERLRGG